ncbi:hypothetical protein E2C01_073996 [Portunus trituberculatus]|uniref:Reverse transcriptase domain-containing protein n=1 Tax=Portunus trituberculatus TaxID=210409 RepID=A0A5B7ID56_PORTR|nr:hypothetical protein [Portunus trituberculatus]
MSQEEVELSHRCLPDGFHGWHYTLVLMDDTVLLSTNRVNEKIKLLQSFCSEHGIVINEAKTKFFVISGAQEDEKPLRVDGLTIASCSMYVYLGSPFTSNGSVTSTLKVHATTKLSHVLKFV